MKPMNGLMKGSLAPDSRCRESNLGQDFEAQPDEIGGSDGAVVWTKPGETAADRGPGA